MRTLGLCAGYGGLEIAINKLIGATLTAYAENGAAASKVMRARFPSVPNLGDIRHVDWEAVGTFEVIAAGFPCQDISNAGTRTGINGKRSGVWSEVAKAIGAVRPRIVFLENVAAIRYKRRGLSRVLGDLATLGYDARWLCLRSSDIGGATQRERWFCIATPANSVGPRLETGSNLYENNRQAAVRGDSLFADSESIGRTERRTESEEQPGGVRRATGHGGESTSDTYGRGWYGRTWHESESYGRNESAYGSYSPAEWWGEYLPAIRRWETLFGIATPMPTEVGPRGGRRLAAFFAEWLLGLPPGWVTDVQGLSRSDQLHVIGNGVMPQQAHEGYRRLMHSWDYIKWRQP